MRNVNKISPELLVHIVKEVKKRLYYDEAFRAEINAQRKNRNNVLW